MSTAVASGGSTIKQNDQQIVIQFPPPLSTKQLSLVKLLPALNAQEQIIFYNSLQQNFLNATSDTANNNVNEEDIMPTDLNMLSNHYQKLFITVNDDLKTLANAPFAGFWSYLCNDDTVVPALHSYLITLPTYIEQIYTLNKISTIFNPDGLSGGNNNKNLYTTYQQYDKSTALGQYFELFYAATGVGISTGNNNNNKNKIKMKKNLF
eukprot:UN03841